MNEQANGLPEQPGVNGQTPQGLQGPQVPQAAREALLLAQNIEMAHKLNAMAGQMQFLQGRLNEVVPPVPVPVYPSTDMPANPAGPGIPPIDHPRANCEGAIEAMPDPKLSVIAPPVEGKLRIMIAVPMLAVSYEFFESFLRFWTQLLACQDPRYELCYHFAYRRPVHMAEEYLVKMAQHNKCTHILLMDDDIFDITPRELNLLVEAKKEFISGVMYASKFPHAMCVFRRYDPQKRVIDMPADTSMYRLYEVPAFCPECKVPQSHWDVKFCVACGKSINIAVQECDLVPFPFTLIDLKIFDRIKQPWFHCTAGYPTDSWFCDRLMEAGIKPHAHMLVRLNHAGISDATRPHFLGMGMAKMQASKAVVHLSPEQMEIHQNLLMKKMREVEESVKPRLPIIGEAGDIVSGNLDKEMTLQSVGH